MPLIWPRLGTWPTTQACALTGNQTGDLLLCRPTTLNQLITAVRAIIHSLTEKEDQYLPTMLQSPVIIVSALSTLEFTVAPSLWNLSQKPSHKTRSWPYPVLSSSHIPAWDPTAPQLSSGGFQASVKRVLWPPSPYPVVPALFLE